MTPTFKFPKLYSIAIVFLSLIIFTNESVFGSAFQDPLGRKPPKDWFHKDIKADNLRGISTEKAYELLSGKPSKKVIVAVIDSGIDTEHEDLNSVIWKNSKEIPNNKIDDDKNGYVDDIHGWNFIGGADGSHVDKDTYEVTREFKRLDQKYSSLDLIDTRGINREEFQYYSKVREQYFDKLDEVNAQFDQIKQLHDSYMNAEATVMEKLGVKQLNIEGLEALSFDDADTERARMFLVLIKQNNITKDQLTEAYEYLDSSIKFGYNTDFDPRHIVGDNYLDFDNRNYGNNDVAGPDPKHGTHVAGIIGANRDNEIGINGIANNVEIMVIRAVPNGDERDKDVANAIRYAVDNGAKIINMSFGKPLSPQKFLVDEAIKYAEKKGVLLIHAAGNEAMSIDSAENYPTRAFSHRKNLAKNWIEVGASSWGGPENFVGNFSNFGKIWVDVFAPGVDIYSTTPNNTYEFQNGTSMAAPMVSGLAALLLSHYPSMKVKDLKKIILDSSVSYKGTKVMAPGGEEMVDFSILSNTGGIINAYEAVKMADKKFGKKNKPALFN
jgi:subtilisin family serine protease